MLVWCIIFYYSICGVCVFMRLYIYIITRCVSHSDPVCFLSGLEGALKRVTRQEFFKSVRACLSARDFQSLHTYGFQLEQLAKHTVCY